MGESSDNAVRCDICPRACVILPGQVGSCRVRGNVDGEIRTLTYGRACSAGVDPVEKKPLFHVMPGNPILSLATAGCNLRCKHCQNWQISQAGADEVQSQSLLPEDLPALARRHCCEMVAYTYTEPFVFYDYTLDCCRAASDAGLKNVLVTAAYVNPEPVRRLCEFVDAANVDIKAMSDAHYRDVCGASLAPVLKAIEAMRDCGVFLEITNLVIPTINDSDELLGSLCQWVKQNLGAETPLHFSRFFPQYRMDSLPSTPEQTLYRAREIARATGLKHVYIGNLHTRDGETTCCAHCGEVLIERECYTVMRNLVANGCCPVCGARVSGIWN